MRLLDAIILALQQIRVQKLKSFFTLIGVIIGVMFLIAVVSIVEGLNKKIEVDFAGKFLGVNTFNVRRMPNIQMGDVTEAEWRSWRQRPRITAADADAIHAGLPDDARWAIQDQRQVKAQTDFTRSAGSVRAEAVTAGYFVIKDIGVEKGRLFTEQEDALGAPVVVIGTDIAKTYFPNIDPIDRIIRMEGYEFRVVGVMEKQGTSLGFNFDNQIFGPFHSVMNRVTLSHRDIAGVVVQAPSEQSMPELQSTVREIMRRRRHLRPGEADNFVFETTQSAFSAWDTIKQVLVKVGVALPAIGLVVGAMVIMNIMLVAVAERTREIGIRKALGARQRDILWQFLVESSTLSVVGSLIGIAFGFGISLLVTMFGLPTSVAPWSVVLSVIVGAGVGIVAGTFPAVKAARLDPIAALRAD
jgi:putative ABC transport system permease protein